MSTFGIDSCALQGLMIVQRKRLADHRGFFSRLYCSDDLRAAGFPEEIRQINQSYTRNRGTVRGMHYQKEPHAEIKFVSVLRGEIFDVCVDLRARSPSFLQWHAEVLSADNMRSVLIPRGFAHGFQTLTNDCELIYLHTMAYVPASEAGINPRDPKLAIEWPLEPTNMSKRDAEHPPISGGFEGLDQ